MRAALALLTLALMAAGCGFRPLYAVPGTPSGSMRTELGSIYVEPVPERLGYELRNQVIDLIDAERDVRAAAYRLRLNVSTKTEAIGVQSQQAPGGITQTAITRYNDTLSVDYELVDVRTNKVVAHGTETGLSSYNVLGSPYATLSVQQDADRHAAQDIADRLRIDLAVHFAQAAKTTK